VHPLSFALDLNFTCDYQISFLITTGAVIVGTADIAVHATTAAFSFAIWPILQRIIIVSTVWIC